jgi:hypothetical protein
MPQPLQEIHTRARAEQQTADWKRPLEPVRPTRESSPPGPAGAINRLPTESGL